MDNEKERSFNEKEVSLVFKRAIELQHRSGNELASSSELSLGELSKIASEAGISPDYLNQALEELDSKVKSGNLALSEKLMGGPSSILMEIAVDGELDEKHFDELVPLIQSITKSHGQQ